MSALEPWQEPEREPIRAHIPHVECDAEGCSAPLLYDAVWHERQTDTLHLLHLCGWHGVWVKGKGPIVVFPLHRAPALQAIARWMQQEIARRRAAAQPQTVRVTFNGGYVGGWGSTNSGTTTGNWGYFR